MLLMCYNRYKGIIMNKIEYLIMLNEEKTILKKNLAYHQTDKKRDFLYKRLARVTIEIERVKNENSNSTKSSNQKKS